MNFYLFYGYAAFLSGLGLIEVEAIYHVNSFKSARYSEGRGIIEYQPPRHIVYIGENYKDYELIQKNLNDPRYPCDPWDSHLAYIKKRKIQGRSAVKGTHAYELTKIATYTRCDDEDHSMTIEPENKKVKITFADATDCEAFGKFLHDEAANFGYGITLKE